MDDMIWVSLLPSSEVNGKGQDSSDVLASEQMAPRGQLVFFVGIGALIFVPVFKALTGLPPFMGILLGLGVLWILTDAIHYGESERQKLKVPQALSRIDTQGVLFFLGILLSVSRWIQEHFLNICVSCTYFYAHDILLDIVAVFFSICLRKNHFQDVYDIWIGTYCIYIHMWYAKVITPAL